jgi:hypothetical protein
MSSQIVGSSAGLPTPNVQPNFDIKVSMGRKKEPTALSEEMRASMVNALHAVRLQGIKKLGESGTLKITKDKILAQKGNKWIDLLQDKEVSRTQRKKAEKIISIMASVLGKENAVIHVEVSQKKTIEKVFEHHLLAEEHYLTSVKNAEIKLQLSSTVQLLNEKNIDDEKIAEITLSLKTLRKAAQDVYNIMGKVNTHLRKETPEEVRAALDIYAQKMPLAFEKYCQAQKAWQSEQLYIRNLCGDEMPAELGLDIFHPERQDLIAAELTRSVKQVITDLDEQVLIQTNAMIQTAAFQYKEYLYLIDPIEKKMTELYAKEWAFNDELEAALEALNEDFIAQRVRDGFLKDDLEEYRNTLEFIKQHSDVAVNVIHKSLSWLKIGNIEQAIDHFVAEFDNLYPSYIDNCRYLFIPQMLSKGKYLGNPLEAKPFNINLKHPLLHATFLNDVHHLVGKTNSRLSQMGLRTQVNLETGEEFPLYTPQAPVVAIPDSLPTTLSAMKDKVSELNYDLFQPKLAQTINVNHKRNAGFTVINGQPAAGLMHQIGAFVEKYKTHRELFEAVMRQHGISDLESSFIFNNFLDAHEALKAWNQRFQHVVDLANQEKYEEAMQHYADMMLEDFPSLTARLGQFNVAAKKISEGRVQKAFVNFAARTGISNAGQVLSSLWLENTAINLEREFQECVNLMQESTFVEEEEVPWMDVTPHILNAQEAAKKALRQSESEYYQFVGWMPGNAHFMNFFNQLKSSEVDIFKKYDWTSGDMKAFDQLYRRFASVVRPLREADHAIVTETDAQKKRALAAQRKELAKKLMPEIEKLEAALQKSGGFAKLEYFIQAVKIIGVRGGFAANPRTELEALYASKENVAGTDFMSADDLINRLESVIESHAPTERENLRNEFRQELQLIQQIRFIEWASSSALLLRDQAKYLDSVSVDLGYMPKNQMNKVKTVLLEAHKNEEFKRSLESAGWSEKDLNRLNTLYNAYEKQSLPLEKAKAEFEADPESVELQQAFRKMTETVVPKLHQLETDIRREFGIDKVERLESEMKNFAGLLTESHDRISIELNDTNTTKKVKAKLIPIVENIAASIRTLSDPPFLKTIDEIREMCIASERVALQSLMSWDKDFFRVLSSKKSPLLLVKKDDAIYWNQLLDDNGLKSTDVEKIVKLYESYQQSLKQIVLLERKLEAHPEDTKTRSALISQLNKNRKKLQQLERDFTEINQEVGNLEMTIRELNNHLKNVQNEMLQSGESDSETRALRNEEQTGGLSDEQIAALIDLTDHLKLLDAFNQKQHFIHGTYRRFSFA